MHEGLLALDDEPVLPEPELDDVVYEVTTSEPLLSYVADAQPERLSGRTLDPEALDPVIFAGLIAP